VDRAIRPRHILATDLLGDLLEARARLAEFDRLTPALRDRDGMLLRLGLTHARTAVGRSDIA